MKLKDVNLGNSFEQLNKVLRNPMDIHIIQDGLIDLEFKNESTYVRAMVKAAKQGKMIAVIKQIKSDAIDNRRMMVEMIGDYLLTKIENFEL